MKILIYLTLIIFPISNIEARDPGTGSNTTLGGPGPATPDAGSGDTSIMGGGTPGNEGEDTFGVRDPSKKELRQIREEQEERKKKSEESREKQECYFSC